MIKPAKLQVKKPAHPYIMKKRKLQSPSSSSLKASQARAANYYESMSNQTINMSVFVGKSCWCILVRRVTPVELWSREEGRMEDFYKMKDKIQYHFQSGSKRRPFSSGSYEVKDIGELDFSSGSGWATSCSGFVRRS